VGFNPNDEQHQFGATLGGPIQRSKTFLFAGYDQHIFNVPAVVEFENGSTTVVPQVGVYPTPGTTRFAIPLLVESACDEALVLASAAQLSTNGRDVSLRIAGGDGISEAGPCADAASVSFGAAEHSPILRDKQRLFDPGSPITNYAISANGEEDVATESASLSLLSGISPRLTSHLRVQFSRDLEQSFPNTTGVRTNIYSWMEGFRAIVDLAAGNAENTGCMRRRL
jgi:hypothetical protein